jgi:hypothetical protein
VITRSESDISEEDEKEMDHLFVDNNYMGNVREKIDISYKFCMVLYIL